MEWESFEDDKVVVFMNEYFVNIKVDCEEWLDVDQIYMEVCQVINGSGGWLLNCFLLFDCRVYFVGIYYLFWLMYNCFFWIQVLQYMKDVFYDWYEEVEKQAGWLMDFVVGSDIIFFKEDFLNVFLEGFFFMGGFKVIYENLV